MTVLEDIPSIIYSTNSIQQAILNNEKIEDKLNVMVVLSNPCNYQKRIQLAKEFIHRMSKNEDITLYVVELIYTNLNESYTITDPDNKNHLQLHTQIPLWHKENMINLGIKKLLPKDWKACAFIDADIEFENIHWASDTLRILNGSRDVVQLFSIAHDMDQKENTMRIFKSFGYQISLGKKYTKKGIEYWHPGFCWAITRKAYEKIGGLYEVSILGSGDHIMSLCFIGNGQSSIHQDVTNGYKESIRNFQKNSCNFRVGYTPGSIRHFFHGSKKNRKYQERWKFLVDNNFDPLTMLSHDSSGLIVPNENFPNLLKDQILQYFRDRKEDE